MCLTDKFFIVHLSARTTCKREINIVLWALSLSQLVLSQYGSGKQMSSLQKQGAWPAAVCSQEHCRDRHLHLPETRKCVRGVSGSRMCKQTAKANMSSRERVLPIVGFLVVSKTFSKFTWEKNGYVGIMLSWTGLTDKNLGSTAFLATVTLHSYSCWLLTY